METDLDMKTACEISATSTKVRSSGNRKIEVLIPITTLMVALSILFISLCCFSTGLAQFSKGSDLSKTFGRHLNIYQINRVNKPLKLVDFDYFVLEQLPGQDIYQPSFDFLGRVAVGGYLSLVGGHNYPFSAAAIKRNAQGEYEWLEFETEETNGEKFIFNGRFLKRRIEHRPNIVSYLQGTLTRIKHGRIVTKCRLPFTIYADE